MLLCFARKRLGVYGLAVIGALLISAIFYWTHTRYIDLLSRMKLLEALQVEVVKMITTVDKLKDDINNVKISGDEMYAKITQVREKVLQTSFMAENAPDHPVAIPAPVSRLPLLHPSVNVVPSFPDSPLIYRDCIPLPRAKPGTTICIHPAVRDKWVSGELKQGRLWEADLVSEMLSFMKSETDIQLVDLGANIGVFTLSAAAAGFDVLAVEMMAGNVHLLQTSLSESQLGEKVTLVNNAVYSQHTSMGVKTDQNNVGGTGLDLRNSTLQRDEVKTVCIDDLVPLVKHRKVYVKMDIEQAELQALSCSTKFFQQVDVRVLMMESMGKSKQDEATIMKFFTDQGMKISKRASVLAPVNFQAVKNVFFIRR